MSGWRAGGTVARLSGDEFVIMFENLHSDQEVLPAAARIAGAIRAPFEAAAAAAAAAGAGTIPLALTASIGIALFGGADQTHEALLANADSALCRAKRNGRNRRDGVALHGR